ncbi:MAG TPA: TetR/AcrR family transcriptional regulator, partial [Caulobacteraceae bacterium]|nr:TetR/AcrR family transcriptional regulator [Caulobacteraceae bacterium]
HHLKRRKAAMRYEPDHKEETRQKVLRAAARAIRAEGPHKIAVAKVMARAGLTHGGFYAHFASKDDLVAAAIDQMFVEAKSRHMLETAGRDPASALGAYIDFYLGQEHRDARATGCPMPALAADLPRLTDTARARFAAGVQGLRERIATLLAGLKATDPDAEASSMIAELVGALSLARAEPDPAASDLILTRSKAALKRRLNLEA